MYYKKKGSLGLAAMVTINNETIRVEDVFGLEKYTEYEFQVLAFTSAGDGPKSSVLVERTNEDGKFRKTECRRRVPPSSVITIMIKCL